MSGRTLGTIPLRDGRRAEIAYLVAADAAPLLAYAEVLASETDYVSFGPGEFGMTAEQEVAFIESLADGSKGLALKATVGGALVGTAVLTRPTRARVRHAAELGLSVLKAYWGGGIGRALCAALFAEGKRVGVERVWLRVRVDNARAIRLYESLGFAHEGRLADAFRVGDVSYDEFVMGLRV